MLSAVSAHEKDQAALNMMKESILVQLLQFDEDGSGQLSKQELTNALHNEKSRRVLADLEVDITYVQELLGMLFLRDNEVSIETVMDLLLYSRGDLPTTVKHMTSHLTFTRWMNETTLAKLETNIESLLTNIVLR